MIGVGDDSYANSPAVGGGTHSYLCFRKPHTGFPVRKYRKELRQKLPRLFSIILINYFLK